MNLRKITLASAASLFLTSSIIMSVGAAPSALSVNQYLTIGMAGNEVAQLQEALTYLGYLDSIIDGYFGYVTESAVINYQTVNGLYIDGEAGPSTLTSINAFLNTYEDQPEDSETVTETQTPSGNEAYTFTRDLYYGTSGSDVQLLQQLLVDQGYLNSSIDGIFGYITEAAVYNFQIANGLYADGIAGPQTISALIEKILPEENVPTDEPDTPSAEPDAPQIKEENTLVHISASDFPRSLYYGTNGEDVAALQSRLTELGYLDSVIDGIFGYYTEAALMEYQYYNNLYADGVAGPLTLSSLFPAYTIPDDNLTADVNTRKIIFIGDSRTGLMYRTISNSAAAESLVHGIDGNIWSSCPGEGYYWMTSAGVPQIEEYIDSSTDIVILTGINDILSTTVFSHNYCFYLNTKAAYWKTLGAHVYYGSVGPVGNFNEADNYLEYNNYGNISEWNTNMKNGLSANVNYIDLFSELIKGYNTIDGVHYNKETTLKMYNFLINNR